MRMQHVATSTPKHALAWLLFEAACVCAATGRVSRRATSLPRRRAQGPRRAWHDLCDPGDGVALQDRGRAACVVRGRSASGAGDPALPRQRLQPLHEAAHGLQRRQPRCPGVRCSGKAHTPG